jgi:hypothetical protein
LETIGKQIAFQKKEKIRKNKDREEKNDYYYYMFT